jgi:hypothetical protein
MDSDLQAALLESALLAKISEAVQAHDGAVGQSRDRRIEANAVASGSGLTRAKKTAPRAVTVAGEETDDSLDYVDLPERGTPPPRPVAAVASTSADLLDLSNSYESDDFEEVEVGPTATLPSIRPSIPAPVASPLPSSAPPPLPSSLVARAYSRKSLMESVLNDSDSEPDDQSPRRSAVAAAPSTTGFTAPRLAANSRRRLISTAHSQPSPRQDGEAVNASDFGRSPSPLDPLRRHRQTAASPLDAGKQEVAKEGPADEAAETSISDPQRDGEPSDEEMEQVAVFPPPATLRRLPSPSLPAIPSPAPSIFLSRTLSRLDPSMNVRGDLTEPICFNGFPPGDVKSHFPAPACSPSAGLDLRKPLTKPEGFEEAAGDGDDEEEEVFFSDWENSLSPPPRDSNRPALFRPADEDGFDGYAEEPDLEDEEEREAMKNLEREQDQYADIVSQLKNRKLEDMRNEAQGDVLKLSAQRNVDQRNADGVTRQMASDIKVRLRAFLLSGLSFDRLRFYRTFLTSSASPTSTPRKKPKPSAPICSRVASLTGS